ncbi:hypothetical protein X474_03275 [Dethiosulfatarculus sandiegensis]|uniref:Uncharacterized protein n=1 Tax=Dethiosulfatarculus sandiegensis TaxID=1429043 RepID=A0A0D2GM36_9BACT|nr:hypothetical protein X474_03275 [Dethiosulfatarculus sandiegensis]
MPKKPEFFLSYEIKFLHRQSDKHNYASTWAITCLTNEKHDNSESYLNPLCLF